MTAPAKQRVASGSTTKRSAVIVFACFAFAYFFSALVRGVTATLAPNFSAEIGLSAGDLGLLAGAYFFGFAAMQLPLGGALDKFGPKRVLLFFLCFAVLGSAAFASARGFVSLTLARTLIGVGVCACLMAPMTRFRHSFDATAQMRANSWMLMTGSLGMLASTLPVQWLLPLWGWRALFVCLAVMFALAMVLIAAFVTSDAAPDAAPHAPVHGGYAEVELPVTRDLDMIGRFDFLYRTGNVLTTSELKARSAVVRYTLGTAYTLERGYRVKLSGETYSFSDEGPTGHHVALSGHVGVVGTF